MELSQGVKRLLKEYQLWHEEMQPHEGISVVSVDEVAVKVASFYEKIRGVVDWREEHLLRKTAIERILKRRIFFRTNGEDLAEPFVKELVRGGHFPNDRIPESKIDEVRKIITKYLFLLENISKDTSEKLLAETKTWLLSIAAAEIEELLAPAIKERALIEFMSREMEEMIVLKNVDLSREEKIMQITVTVHRALFKLDDATIIYHLLEHIYADWKNPSEQTLNTIAQNISGVKKDLNRILYHPLSEKFYQLMEQYDTPYLLLGDIIAGDTNEFESLTANPPAFEKAIVTAYEARLVKLKGRMKRAAFFGTLSVFLSKVLVVLAIEIPFDKYVMQELNYSTIGLSVAIPVFLMLLLVTTIKSTSIENRQRVIMEMMKTTYETKREDVYEITVPKRKKIGLTSAIQSIYLFSFVLSYGLLIWILTKFSFSWPSIIVFLVFLSLIAFAGTRIRQRGRELLLGKPKQGFLFTLFDIFALPIIHTGKWLSRQVAKYNILVVVLNFLIEAPFQIFVEFFEHWRSFLKEKREEVH